MTSPLLYQVQLCTPLPEQIAAVFHFPNLNVGCRTLKQREHIHIIQIDIGLTLLLVRIPLDLKTTC